MCKCPRCGLEFEAVAKDTYTARSSVRSYTRDEHGGLVQTYPPISKPVRQRTMTRARLEQALTVGACCTSGLLVFALPLNPPPSVLLPLSTGVFVLSSAGTFVLSVALGKDNQDALFRLLDRNQDGKLDRKDLPRIVNQVLDEVLEPEQPTPQLKSNTPSVVYGYLVTRWLSDERTLLRATLLPDYPRYNTKEKLRQCARLYFELDGNTNFSKRQCGAPFEDDIAQVQDELERIGYIVRDSKAKNATRQWTSEGKLWLNEFLPTPLPYNEVVDSEK